MANAWDAYVQNLMGYPKINFASIHGIDGTVYSCHHTVRTSPAEIAAVVKAVKEIGLLNKEINLPSFTLGGQKFITLRVLEETVDAKQSNHTVSIAICDKVVVVAGHLAETNETADPTLSAAVNTAASKMKDYLKKSGW